MRKEGVRGSAERKWFEDRQRGRGLRIGREEGFRGLAEMKGFEDWQRGRGLRIGRAEGIRGSAESSAGNSLIRSFHSNQSSDCERFTQIAQDK